MTATVSSVYKEGKLELLEVPKGLHKGLVRVVLTEDETTELTPQYLVRGKYPGDTPLEAFKEAEWHCEEEFDDLYGS